MESPKVAHQSILEEALYLVNGIRQEQYGSPSDNWNTTAELFTTFLQARGLLGRGVRITARDAALLMVLVKLAREGKNFNRENLVDIAGYAEVANRVIPPAPSLATDR